MIGNAVGRVSKTARRPCRWAVAVILFAAAGCQDGGAGGDGTREASQARFQRTVAALCTSAEQAQESRAAAKRTFEDRAHGPLHELAAAVEVVDRAAAAELLRAKNLVEIDFAGSTGGRVLERELLDLLDASAQALTALRIEIPGCASRR